MSPAQTYLHSNVDPSGSAVKIGMCTCPDVAYVMLNTVEGRTNRFSIQCAHKNAHKMAEVQLADALRSLDGRHKTTKAALGALISTWKGSIEVIGNTDTSMELVRVPVVRCDDDEEDDGIEEYAVSDAEDTTDGAHDGGVTTARMGPMVRSGAGSVVQRASTAIGAVLPIALFVDGNGRLNIAIFNAIHFTAETLAAGVTLAVDVAAVWSALQARDLEALTNAIASIMQEFVPWHIRAMFMGNTGLRIGAKMLINAFAPGMQQVPQETLEFPHPDSLPDAEQDALRNYLQRKRDCASGRVLGEVTDADGDVEMGGVGDRVVTRSQAKRNT